jgi:hypothetical protein
MICVSCERHDFLTLGSSSPICMTCAAARHQAALTGKCQCNKKSREGQMSRCLAPRSKRFDTRA